MNNQTIKLSQALVLITILLFGSHQAFATTSKLIDIKPAGTLKLKKSPVITPTPPKVAAQAYILVDANSGTVLAEKNADKRRPPASLTKMMTMYVVSDLLRQDRLALDTDVRISKNAWRTGGSKMFVKVGERVPLKELIKGIIVQSGNDACVAVAEHIAGSEDSFANLMNQQAGILGMRSSNFTDSTGMPHKNHYTTARDMAVLARAIIFNFPEEYKWYSQKWFVHNGIRQPNRNRLLWRNPDVDGIKTGHTQEAGYCLVSSAKTDGMRLIAVVMGAPSDDTRTRDSQSLLTYGFRFFETHNLYKAGQNLESPRIWLGKSATTPVGVTQDVAITIPRGEYKNLKATLVLQKRIHAPIKKGQELGQLEIKLHDKVISERPLIALEGNEKGGLWTRMRDSVKLSLYKWLGIESES